MTGYLTFDQTIDRLHRLYHQPIIPAPQVGLERAAYLLGRLGDPHRTFRSTHVTGSCGKGSTTTMVGSVLQAGGFRTGYFRSPHLVSYRERIAVDGEDIDEESWLRCFGRVWPLVESMCDGTASGYTLGRPSHFEVLFAMMAVFFAERNVKWAAVEAGMGGRLDATNLLDSDVAVITNVSLEHTHILGETVGAIAREKAAIIKHGSHAVTASEDPIVLEIIEQRAADVGAPLLRVGRDIKVRVNSEQLKSQRITLETTNDFLTIRLPVGGRFQASNAATAFAAITALKDRGVQLSDREIVRGFEQVQIPGRFELVSRNPSVILDGAHNPAEAHALRTALEPSLAGRRLILLFAAMADKDVAGMARQLGPISDAVIMTTAPDSEKAAALQALARAFEPWASEIVMEEDWRQALNLARSRTQRDCVLLVTGSMYLVGRVRTELLVAVAG